MSDRYQLAALRRVNAARKALGLRHRNRLARGLRLTANLCPIARSVRPDGDRIMVWYSYPFLTENRLPEGQLWVLGASAADLMPSQTLDADAVEFAHRFDLGHYPELVLSPIASEES